MTIVACPKCRDHVSIPDGVHSHVRVRCPLCLEEYSLARALAELPPLLEVVHESEAFDDPDESRSVVVEPARSAAEQDGSPEVDQLPAVDERAEVGVQANWKHPRETWTPATESAFPLEHTVKTSKLKSNGSRGRSRPKKESGPIKGIFQVVGGGVLGLIIAQVILWWIPGKWDRSNRDPLGLADTVARYVPFILPIQLRSEPTSTAGTIQDLISLAPEKSENRSEIPVDGSAERPGDASVAADIPAQENPGPTTIATSAIGTVAPASAQAPATAADGAAEHVILRHAMLIDSSEIGRRLATAQKANAAWDNSAEASGDERKKLFIGLYDAISRVGEACILANSTDSHAKLDDDQIHKLLESIASQPATLRNLPNYSAFYWLDNAERSHQGVALYGTVVTHGIRGGLRVLHLKSASKDGRQIEIVPSNQSVELPPLETRLLILGLIVGDPAKNLEGFDGDTKEVIVTADQLALPAS